MLRLLRAGRNAVSHTNKQLVELSYVKNLDSSQIQHIYEQQYPNCLITRFKSDYLSCDYCTTYASTHPSP